MLPEFPRAHEAIQKVWNRFLFDAAEFSDPLISQISIRVQREGHRARFGESEVEYKKHSVSHQWKTERGKGMPTDEFFKLPLQVGKQIAEGQAKAVFGAMLESAPSTGVFDRKEGALTFEMWLKKMDAYELDFDERGIPRWPQWFMAEDAIDEFKASINQGSFTPEQTRLQAELITKKRKEFNEREARRRLVE